MNELQDQINAIYEIMTSESQARIIRAKMEAEVMEMIRDLSDRVRKLEEKA